MLQAFEFLHSDGQRVFRQAFLELPLCLCLYWSQRCRNAEMQEAKNFRKREPLSKYYISMPFLYALL